MRLVLDDWKSIEGPDGGSEKAVFRDGILVARITASPDAHDLPFGLDWPQGPLWMEDERRFADLRAVVDAIERRCGERRTDKQAVDRERRRYPRRATDRR